jgi:hypothetical protein
MNSNTAYETVVIGKISGMCLYRKWFTSSTLAIEHAKKLHKHLSRNLKIKVLEYKDLTKKGRGIIFEV